MNNAVIIGRLTKDPETRHTQSGQTNTSFTLAVDRGLSKEKKQEHEAKGYSTADFIRIVAWNKTAELCSQYLNKGLQVAIQGRIQTGSYTNNQGQKVYTTDVVADRVHFLEWPDEDKFRQNNNQGQNNQQEQVSFDQDFVPIDNGDYIPF